MDGSSHRNIEPGVYRGISNDAYHSGPGVSKSGLDLISKAPVNFRGVMTGAIERKPTPSQAFGTAFHCLLLEPAKFSTEYAPEFVPPTGALVTVEDLKNALTEGGIAHKSSAKRAELEQLVRDNLPGAVILSDARAAHFAEHPGQPLTTDDWRRLHSMVDAVMAHPMARSLLAGAGESELSGYAMIGDQLVRVRPDWYRRDGWMLDVKSTSPGGAAPEEFARSVLNWRYHVQAPVYLDVFAEALAASQSRDEFIDYAKPKGFAFLAVETDACVIDGVAKGVAVYMLDEDAIALGRMEYRRDLDTLAECQSVGHWPGYGDAAMSLSLPGYAYTRAGVQVGA